MRSWPSGTSSAAVVSDGGPRRLVGGPLPYVARWKADLHQRENEMAARRSTTVRRRAIDSPFPQRRQLEHLGWARLEAALDGRRCPWCHRELAHFMDWGDGYYNADCESCLLHFAMSRSAAVLDRMLEIAGREAAPYRIAFSCWLHPPVPPLRHEEGTWKNILHP